MAGVNAGCLMGAALLVLNGESFGQLGWIDLTGGPMGDSFVSDRMLLVLEDVSFV